MGRAREAAEMSLRSVIAPLLLSLASGAPYSPNGVAEAPQPARLNTGSVECRTEYTTVWDTQYQEKETQQCSTEYKEDCEYQWEGHGNNKVWAPIPGTCKQNPYDSCKDVSKTKEKQVAYPVCRDVPEQVCQDVPRQQCRQVPDQVCSNQPLQQCRDVPRQHCTNKHKKVPVRISKTVPKKVCDSGHGYSAPPAVLPEVVLDIGRTKNVVRSNKIVFADE